MLLTEGFWGWVFWDQFNTDWRSYVTRADRRVKGWLHRDGWFAKVDNRFGYEKWLQGGSIGLVSLI